MKHFITYLFVLFPAFYFAQVPAVDDDTTEYEYMFIEGDSVPQTIVNLNPIYIMGNLKFASKEDRIRYLILRRKTLKVYPYAKMASERLDSLNARLESMKKASDKRRYTKIIQKYIEGEFSEELKKLSRTEGQILVKLIHRQTGKTTFGLVKELRSGWRAFWYNTTAGMFDISLKKPFDPKNVYEDYLIEDILQRSFRSGLLVRQKAAEEYNFYDLTDIWLDKEKNKK
ncbi:DUF4294 domain-containing protein [Mariniflexile maritimum]|jgi:hypothetical protein|uniref:DUF4294 domain-containing protein n=1 Tax=Mariniflexile maritimum TaxID=2682493 RepID=UPI0012F6ABD3|nr:DUF4294 domain-containing protein [Mariniflexile maritimum]HMR16622.1 DUF4294 domain-containing protein [Mariniflexile sp.]